MERVRVRKLSCVSEHASSMSRSGFVKRSLVSCGEAVWMEEVGAEV